MNFTKPDFVLARQSRRTVAESIAKGIALTEIEETFFPNGEANFRIPALHGFTGARVLFVADWSSFGERYLDMTCLIPIAEMQPRLLTIVVPFLPTATQERETADGVVVTANCDSRLLSMFKCPVRVVTVDLHTLQGQFYFGSNVCCTVASTMPYAAHMFSAVPVVVFPDDGAAKRFRTYFADRQLVACTKVRGEGDKRVVTLESGAEKIVADQSVLIVDDIVRSGNTLLECVKAVKAAGAKCVAVFVPHADFEGDSYRKFQDCGFAFWTTDSVGRKCDNGMEMIKVLCDNPWFRFISLGTALAYQINGDQI